jgi:hypothetical protein
MTSWLSFAANGFTLHSWLSMLEVAISLAVLCALGMSVWKRSQPKSEKTLSCSPVTTGRFGIPALRLHVAKLSSRFSTIRTRTKGTARPLTPLLLACLTMPSVGAGFVAGYYASQANKVSNVHTWFNVQVVEKADPLHYRVHVQGRQLSEAFFLCPDSRYDANWDEGMTLKSVTFEMRENCRSIHADILGFYVDRIGTQFIHFTKEYDQ